MKLKKRSYLQRITATVLSLLLIAQGGVFPVVVVAETAAGTGTEITLFEPLVDSILHQTVPFGTELGDLYLPTYLTVLVRSYMEPEPEIEEGGYGEGLYVAAWVAFAEAGETEVELVPDAETGTETEEAEAETGTETEEPQDEPEPEAETGENDVTDPDDSDEPGAGSDPGGNDGSGADTDEPEADSDDDSYYDDPLHENGEGYPYGENKEDGYETDEDKDEYPYEEYPYEDYPYEEYDENEESDYCYYYYYYYYGDEIDLVPQLPTERSLYPVFEQMTLPVTWVSAPAFYANMAGTFVFTPVLPQGVFWTGAVPPVITVTVEPLGIMPTNARIYIQGGTHATREQALRDAMGMPGTATVVLMEDTNITGPDIAIVGDKTLVNGNPGGSSLVRTAGTGGHFVSGHVWGEDNRFTLGAYNANLANNIAIIGNEDGFGIQISASGGGTGTLVMYGGTISNFGGLAGIHLSINSNMIMYGGNISNNIGGMGGILHQGGVLNIYGGIIANNSSWSGGGITHQGNVLNIHGGSITNNTSTSTGGGGILHQGNVLNIHAGTISNNRALSNGNNVGGGIHNFGWDHANINIGNVNGIDTSHNIIFYGNRTGPVGNDTPPVFTGSQSAFSALRPNIRWQNHTNMNTQQTTSAPAGFNLVNGWDINIGNLQALPLPPIEPEQPEVPPTEPEQPETPPSPPDSPQEPEIPPTEPEHPEQQPETPEIPEVPKTLPTPPQEPEQPIIINPEQEQGIVESYITSFLYLYYYTLAGITPPPAATAVQATQGTLPSGGGMLQTLQQIIITLMPLLQQNQGYSELLRVPIDSPTVYRSIRQNNGQYINLREVEMDTAAWIAPETGSTMIPIRFVSYLLDLPVLWREEESTAIIDPYGMDLRITANSPYMYRNGERLPILNMYGVQVYPLIKDNRLFVPLHGTGAALGLRPAQSYNVAMLYIE